MAAPQGSALRKHQDVRIVIDASGLQLLSSKQKLLQATSFFQLKAPATSSLPLGYTEQTAPCCMLAAHYCTSATF